MEKERQLALEIVDLITEYLQEEGVELSEENIEILSEKIKEVIIEMIIQRKAAEPTDFLNIERNAAEEICDKMKESLEEIGWFNTDSEDLSKEEKEWFCEERIRPELIPNIMDCFVL